MKKKSKMSVELWFGEEDISVKASIELTEELPCELSFALNHEFEIDCIKADGLYVDFTAGDVIDDEFRLPIRPVKVKSPVPIRRLEIAYRGFYRSMVGWGCVINAEHISINWYCSWYPQDVSYPIFDDEVTVWGMEKYLLVKGEFEENTGKWKYGGKGYDPYNLIFFRRDIVDVTSEGEVTVFRSKKGPVQQTELLKDMYKDICGFYNGELFPLKEIPHMDIVCASPYIENEGGYKRNGLLWFSSFGENSLIKPLIAHETAHIWCSGADVNSWEDWLNETTAEWSALLYLKHCGDDDAFNEIISMHRKSAEELPAIKTSDGSRPAGVHDKGVLMFYDICEKYGIDTMRVLLKVFAGLERKSTENYLMALRQAGYHNAADHIEKMICE